MPNRLLRMFILVPGFLSAVLALAWAIALLFLGQFAQNLGSVAVLVIVGLFLMVVGWKK